MISITYAKISQYCEKNSPKIEPYTMIFPARRPSKVIKTRKNIYYELYGIVFQNVVVDLLVEKREENSQNIYHKNSGFF